MEEVVPLNPLPNNNIVDLSELKVFAHCKINGLPDRPMLGSSDSAQIKI